MKQTIRLVLMAAVCLSALSGVAMADTAWDNQAFQALADATMDGNTSMQSTITGKVYFERRETRVIQGFCDDFDCPKPQSYWVLMIDAGSTTYQLNRKINLGSDVPPESFELGGKLIHEGATVQLEARVIYQSNELSILDEVTQLSVLDDPRMPRSLN